MYIYLEDGPFGPKYVPPYINNKHLFVVIAVAQWLRHCATNRKVAGSISDGVIRIFH
jgi:hypothetical protein